MIKKQFFILIVCLMFTNTFATSSMSGIEKQGYFDDEQFEPKKETAKNYRVMSPLNLEGLSPLDLRLFNRD